MMTEAPADVTRFPTREDTPGKVNKLEKNIRSKILKDSIFKNCHTFKEDT
jgi:hypothetical protein